jgi:hypothetical protein
MTIEIGDLVKFRTSNYGYILGIIVRIINDKTELIDLELSEFEVKLKEWPTLGPFVIAVATIDGQVPTLGFWAGAPADIVRVQSIASTMG